MVCSGTCARDRTGEKMGKKDKEYWQGMAWLGGTWEGDVLMIMFRYLLCIA